MTSAPLDIEEVLEQDLEVLMNPSPDQENVDLSLNSTLAIPSKHIQNVYYAGKTDVGRERNRNEDDFTAIFQTFTIHGKSQISDRNHRGLFVL
ncbi:MAG: hypothetical protein ACK45T_01210, partial [Pseudanabaena sp.]